MHHTDLMNYTDLQTMLAIKRVIKKRILRGASVSDINLYKDTLLEVWQSNDRIRTFVQSL